MSPTRHPNPRTGSSAEEVNGGGSGSGRSHLRVRAVGLSGWPRSVLKNSGERVDASIMSERRFALFLALFVGMAVLVMVAVSLTGEPGRVALVGLQSAG